MRAFDASVVGGGFTALELPPEASRERFLFVRFERDEHYTLVKLRGPSDREGVSVSDVKPASRRSTTNLMVNMVRGVLWESADDACKVVDARLDVKEGVLSASLVSNKQLDIQRFAPRLSKTLHVKVLLRQLSSRLHAKSVGWLGLCGMEVCCKRFLGTIPSISMTMARQQFLFASMEKFTGACGRLLCCLAYELPVYKRILQALPPLGARVRTQGGVGEVVALSPLEESFTVRMEDGEERQFSLQDDKDLFSVVRQ